MSRGSLAGIGAALFIVGALLFPAGAFVWTTDARHRSIFPAACVSLVGIVLLIAAGLDAWRKH